MTDQEVKTQLNLHQKILEIRKSVSFLQKTSQAHKNKYVQEQVFFSAIRPKMDELGVLLDFSMRDTQISDGIAIININFRWINCDDPHDKIENTISLQCRAGDPQLIGGCLTYAHRYYLQKFFQIAVDSEDVDTFEGKVAAASKEASKTLSKEQIDSIINLCEGRKDILDMIAKNAPAGKLVNMQAERYQGILNFVLTQLEVKND